MLKPSCAWASSSAPPSRRSSVRQCSGWRRNGGRSGDNAPCVGLTLLLPGQPLFAPPSLDDHADTTWLFSLFLQPDNSQSSNCSLRNTRIFTAAVIPTLELPANCRGSSAKANLATCLTSFIRDRSA